MYHIKCVTLIITKIQIQVTVLDKTTKDFNKKYDVFLISANKTVFKYENCTLKPEDTIKNKVC